MKFAICNETFLDWPLERGFALAAECGYKGIEIAPFTIARSAFEISPARRSEIRRQAEAAGLQVVGLHWLLAKTEGLCLTSPDAAVRRKTADYLAELARLCADLGGRLMVFGSPGQRSLPPGVTPQEGAGFAAEVIAAALPELEKTGVVLALEPLTPQETDFLLTAAEAVELIERIRSPQVRLHLDCKAMASEAVPIPRLIVRNSRYLVHLHANDPNRQGPGFGALNFVPIFRALEVIGYRGWVSVEVFDYSPGVERLARDSLRYMQRCRGGGPG
jgi:sugar phosphate isomerase/epimerase